MDGTSKYVNLKTGPGGGNGMPSGDQVGDLLQWNGSDWEPVQLPVKNPVVYTLHNNIQISDAVPIGCKLVHVTLINPEDGIITATLGITDGGHEILDSEPISAGGHLDLPVDRFYSPTELTPVFFSTPDTLRVGLKMIIETKYYYSV